MDINPAEAAQDQPAEGSRLDGLLGISVVLLATFLGICSVKSGNIGQQMEKAQSDRNNWWLYYQARNLREEMYRTAADEMKALGGGQPSSQVQAMIALYEEKAKDQEAKKETQYKLATAARELYESLSVFDDQFDICEAALTLGLALMGVTALLKKFWLYLLALVPTVFGVFMGVAGFLGWPVSPESLPLIGDFFKMIL